MLSLAGDAEFVGFEKRPLDRDVDCSLRRAAECGGSFGDRVGITLDQIGHLVEEFVNRDESRAAYIPVRLLDLRMQIDRRGKVSVQQFDGFHPDVFRKRIGGAVHLRSPEVNRHSNSHRLPENLRPGLQDGDMLIVTGAQ